MTPLVELNHVSRAFDEGRIVALDDVSLEISHGEAIAITGPSGSGKSTLLNLICGLDVPSCGEVHVEGRVVRGRTKWAQIRARRMGIVFQSFCLISALTAKENIEVAMLGQPGDGVHRHQRALDLLERMGLAERVNLRPMELSGGERQRVAIARALANSPDMLIADEPTGSLDQKSSRSIIKILRELQEQSGLTLLIVTHDQSVASSCNRQVELVDGRIISDTRKPSDQVSAESIRTPVREAP